MSSLSKYEKETIILWNQSDEPISIQTYDAALKRRLREFSEKYPDICFEEDKHDRHGGAFFQLDKGRLSIRLLAPYSKERRKQASEQAKLMAMNQQRATD